MQEHKFFNEKLLWLSGRSVSRLLPRRRLRAAHAACRLPAAHGRGLRSLGSGSLGQSGVLPAKSDAEKNLSELVLSRKKRGGGDVVVDQSATIRSEVAAFGFHETTLTRHKARVGLLG